MHSFLPNNGCIYHIGLLYNIFDDNEVILILVLILSNILILILVLILSNILILIVVLILSNILTGILTRKSNFIFT